MPFLRRKRGCGAPKRVPWYVFVLERLVHQGLKLSGLAIVVAWLLARSSTSTFVNLPVAVAIVIAVRWLSLRLVVDTGSARGSSRSSRRLDRYMGPQMYYREKPNMAGNVDSGTTHNDRDAWKKILNAPIVASAWESLCGSILQEWVYDAWFSLLTPDREFPAAIRRLINEIFAEVAQRAKRIDLRNVLIRDMCDLFTEHLELYRATKEGVGILNKGDLRPSSRDRAFQQEMKTEGTLHVAFCTRDGHYKVIKRICEGIISITMSKEDLARPYTRVLARELLATCLIRPILMYFSPYTANKLILNSLPDPERLQARERSQKDAKIENQNGHFLFEQRVRKSAALEERAAVRAMDKSGAQKTGNGTGSMQDIYLQYQSKQQPLDACSAEDNITGTGMGAQVSKVNQGEQSVDEVNALVMEYDPVAKSASISGQLSGTPEELQTETSLPTNTLHAFSPIALEEASVDQPGAPSIRSETPQCMDSDYTPPRHPTSANVYEMPQSTEDCSGFKGHPRARVVVHEVMYDASNRRYVVFKIRVGDDTGEWTVARRYRNFEALHKVLRDHPVYQDLLLKLPPKSFFRHSQNTEFVEERRVALDRYLQTLLSSRILASNSDVGAFLMDQEHALYKHSLDASLFRTLTDNVDYAKHRMKCAVVSRGRRSQGQGTSVEEDDSQSSQCFPTPRQLENPDDPIFDSLRLNHVSNTPGRLKSTIPDFSAHKAQSMESGFGQPYATISHSSPHTPRSYVQRQQNPSGLQSPWTDTASVVSSRPDSPGKCSQRFDAKSVSMCDTRSQGGSSDTPIRGTGARDDIGREAFAWNSLPVLESEDTWPDWDTEFEDYSGISGPLYEVVESIFALPAQRFFRRQVLHTVRQLLSLLAGDSIDLFLLEKIKSLRTEHTLARIIHMLQNSLWPGGKWFASVPPYSIAMAEYQRDNPGARRAMTRERYLEPLLGHKDADELAGKVYARFLEHPPPALTRIVGKQCYSSGMQDVYDMLQLPTFMTQMGYGVLEIVVLALFPELRDVFVRIHRETVHKKEA